MSEESPNDRPEDAGGPLPAPVQRVSRLGALANAFRVKTNPGVSKFEHLVLAATFRTTDIRVASPIENPELLALYHDTCAKAKMTPGKLLIIDSPIPNAVHMMNGSMAISTGLEKILDQNELQGVMARQKGMGRPELRGVIAHELGHRKHAFKHLWSGLALAVALTAALFIPIRKVTDFFNPGRWDHMDGAHLTDRLRRTGAHLSDGFKALAVGFAAAGMLLRGRSQKNELEADDESVRITGNADALISGLQKVEKRALEIKLSRLRGGVDYLEEKAASHPAPLPAQPELDAELRSEARDEMARGDLAMAANGTHPPMPERTARLQAQSFRQRYENEQLLAAASPSR